MPHDGTLYDASLAITTHIESQTTPTDTALYNTSFLPDIFQTKQPNKNGDAPPLHRATASNAIAGADLRISSTDNVYGTAATKWSAS